MGDEVGYVSAYDQNDLPDRVKLFVQDLWTATIGGERELGQMEYLYDTEYRNVSEDFFASSKWPSTDEVKNLVDSDEPFLLLYKEMQCRHAFTLKGPVSISLLLESWTNYCKLFDLFLKSEFDRPEFPALPSSWAFDILSEFVYQFQFWCQEVSKLRTNAPRTDEDQDLLEANTDAWNPRAVFGYLKNFARVSKIREIMDNEEKCIQEGTQIANPHPNVCQLMMLLGYFSMVQVCRLNTLLGDYHGALRSIDSINTRSRHHKFSGGCCDLYLSVPDCHVNLYYHTAFSQVMSRRYVDAIDTLTNALVYVIRTRYYYDKTPMFDQLTKWNDKCLMMLALCVSLCPGASVDEQVRSHLFDKHGEDIKQMTNGEEKVFTRLYNNSAPRFIRIGKYGESPNQGINDPTKHQLEMFLKEVRQQKDLPTIRSYLTLYRTIDESKLARFRDVDASNFRHQMLSLKHKSNQKICNATSTKNISLTDGEFSLKQDVHFYCDGTVLHVDEIKEEKQFGEYFIDQINNLESITYEIKRPLDYGMVYGQ